MCNWFVVTVEGSMCIMSCAILLTSEIFLVPFMLYFLHICIQCVPLDDDMW
jgi:hypothetical protein